MTTEEEKSVPGVFTHCWKPIRAERSWSWSSEWSATGISTDAVLLPRFRQGEKLVIWAAASGLNVPVSPPKNEWKLFSGLALLSSSVDVSSDRKLAIVWGERTFGNETRKSCWLIDLQTAEIEDLSTTSNGKVAAIVRDPARATFSPDGKHLLISAQGGQTAFILDHSTGNTIAISGLERSDILWSGNRLLILAGWREHPEVFSIAGERQEQPKGADLLSQAIRAEQNCCWGILRR